MVMICLRPHHGLCLLTFQGKGYSPEFVAQMSHLQNQLNLNPQTDLILTDQCDVLCQFCPHCVNNQCSSPLPEKFDKNVLYLTGFKVGQKLTWNELSTLTRQILRNNLNTCCCECEWLPLCSGYH